MEMENIVWDSKKDTEKKRDYVKLLYKLPLDELFDNQEVEKRHEKIRKGYKDPDVPDSASAFTSAGNVVLANVRDTIKSIGRDNVNDLIDANQKVKATMKG